MFFYVLLRGSQHFGCIYGRRSDASWMNLSTARWWWWFFIFRKDHVSIDRHHVKRRNSRWIEWKMFEADNLWKKKYQLIELDCFVYSVLRCSGAGGEKSDRTSNTIQRVEIIKNLNRIIDFKLARLIFDIFFPSILFSRWSVRWGDDTTWLLAQPVWLWLWYRILFLF